MEQTVQKQSGAGGVQYRRAKLWQIILVACNGLSCMAVYSLMGQATYVASIGYGLATVLVGGLLTFTRIFDAITDPFLAILFDRINTPWGKIRPLLMLGWLIQSAGILCLFRMFSGKGHGAVAFVLLYMVYVIGYTIINMTCQSLPAIMTNDPKQRPTVGVWYTIFNYMVPMVMTIVLYRIIMPRTGGTFNQEYLNAAAMVVVVMSFVGVVLVCIGISAYDKPEYFEGLNKSKRLRLKDMLEVIKNNKPFQCFVISAASDKIAQQTSAASIVSTLVSGILIGNMALASTLSVISMIPGIFFAIIGARYAGKHGNKETIVRWTWVSIFVALACIAFLAAIDTKSIATFGATMIIYVVLVLLYNGCSMCITTANNAFKADITDYELDRSGNYIPAVISGTYGFIDKLVSSFSAAIATGCVALLGYTTTMPQPGDPATPQLFWVAMFLRFGIAILGWIVTLIAMRYCKLDKAEMENVQKRIAEKKAAAHRAA